MNKGQILARQPGETISLYGMDLVNEGVLAGEGGGAIAAYLHTPFQNKGTAIFGAGASHSMNSDTRYGSPSYQQTTGLTVVDGTLDTIGMVITGGTLRGHGTIYSDVSNGSIVEPGGSLGTLTVYGNYRQTASGILRIEVGSVADFDQLLVTNTGALDGLLELDVLGGFNAAIGDSWNFLTLGNGYTGAFSGLTVNGSSQLFRLVYSNSGVSVQAVPEPLTLLSLAAGLVLVRGRRHRQA